MEVELHNCGLIFIVVRETDWELGHVFNAFAFQQGNLVFLQLEFDISTEI